MQSSVYAGSFDPWTYGHQFVLDSALEVFESVHVVSAINPAKQSLLKPEVRARVIAHAIDPFIDWWALDPPFRVGEKVIVTSQEGLVADYAKENNISHLIRGLRSTSDFEAEFNLYFSNQAINPKLQTWAVLCPHHLLHCSSTYVKTVVGKAHVKSVGAKFVAQALMLNWVRVIGQIFDLIEVCSSHRFDIDSSNLNETDLSECLQLLFSALAFRILRISRSVMVKTSKYIDTFLKQNGSRLRDEIKENKYYPQTEINNLWAILANCIEQDAIFPDGIDSGVSYLLSLSKNLGKTSIKLFNEDEVYHAYENLKK
ncbi:pantetheine-phosphate adenylyltransferase [Silvanigrella paludirubra]|jgi:pantetheine-phosphate adenylyltransferase|uniref:Phosphopantetheine adenylyltransferase n=1 Tax=Silvanigrella paludirubra TaxID=2499159 RepID=A0A6N6VY06_9BACT|nr:pantetheine-phosphate adenylyltransferase [Silvanigrella paludirubra]KAB8039742.1 pantetheine-phosphate adenylyltransferase [Silvanigrella paludirubra]